MSRPGGLQLSPVQIVASLLATLTGAILASYLGVGGTLTGAAVGSIASTTGTEVYRHYLRRSQERLKAAGQVLRHREATGQHARHAAGQQTGTVAGRHNGRGPDASETQILPAAASAWQRRAGAEPTATQSAGESAGERATGQLSDAPATGELSDDAAPGGDGSGPWWRNLSRRQWLTYGGVALGFFLVAMVIVTIIELSVGKPLDAAVWGKHSTGTSVGNLVGGNGSGHKQPAPHTSTPATQSGTASSSPAATPSGPSPTPTTPVSPTPSSASATPTPGGGASGQEISPTP